jgi:hypothetical protein
MYPDNQDIEIFGERVSWPGVDADGKFTNGSFSDPMVKLSFIPADTVNLILDNMESVIRKCGGTPNAAGAAQIAELITPLVLSKAIVMRDEHGRAKVAAPQAGDDIARLADIVSPLEEIRQVEIRKVENAAASALAKAEAAMPKTGGSFTGIVKVLSKITNATYDGTLIATERQVSNVSEQLQTAIRTRIGMFRGGYNDWSLLLGAYSTFGSGDVFIWTANYWGDFMGSTLKPWGVYQVQPNLDLLEICNIRSDDLKANIASPVFTGTPKIRDANNSENRIAVVAAASNAGATDLPVGSYIFVRGFSIVRNANIPVYINSDDSNSYTTGYRSAINPDQLNVALSGTWRSCGNTDNYILVRRVA